ncbi:formyltransferase family protein [Empedobacter sedimenti]|uniref:formyltransferase family protein n=1 Tax=Empedobacter sedimenti TaxID=3042610 RepID=UPI0024A77582|nr:formyltransferase family protein [Empedobacter sedimenti]
MLQPKIAVISYNTPHRKTQDVLYGLKAKGYHSIKVFALPFVQRENPFVPIYQHRPSKAIQITPSNFCKNFDYDFDLTTTDTLNNQLNDYKADYIIIAGAGLLPNELVENHKIINTHPGFLPLTRGLDSLKWAIVKGVEIGVTTHFIDTEADAGLLIEQQLIPIFENDTFHSLAYRQYETEIEMLVNSIEIIPTMIDFKSLSSNEFEATRRMPKAIEENLMQDFEKYKTKFCQA